MSNEIQIIQNFFTLKERANELGLNVGFINHVISLGVLGAPRLFCFSTLNEFKLFIDAYEIAGEHTAFKLSELKILKEFADYCIDGEGIDSDREKVTYKLTNLIKILEGEKATNE